MADSHSLIETTRKVLDSDLQSAVVAIQSASSGYSSKSNEYVEGRAPIYRLAIGRSEILPGFVSAFHSGDNTRIGSLLGFPECCRRQFDFFWPLGYVDSTLPAAFNSLDSMDEARLSNFEFQMNPGSNLLLRWLGVRPVFHLPCSFNCSPSSLIAGQLTKVGNSIDSEAMDWLKEMLSWSVEWSLLGGIAEIRLPYFKFVVGSDAVSGKRVVRLTGRTPEATPTGLRFPYRDPSSVRKQDLRKFELPEQNNLSLVDGSVLNGFYSKDVMDQSHDALIESLRKAEAGWESSGTVVDLGGGDGTLLARVAECFGLTDLCCVERDIGKCNRAKSKLGKNGEVINSNLFVLPEIIEGSRKFALAILMIGRLTEVSADAASVFWKWLNSKSSCILLYMYNGAGGSEEGRDLATVAENLGIEIEGKLTRTDFGQFVLLNAST